MKYLVQVLPDECAAGRRKVQIFRAPAELVGTPARGLTAMEAPTRAGEVAYAFRSGLRAAAEDAWNQPPTVEVLP